MDSGSIIQYSLAAVAYHSKPKAHVMPALDKCRRELPSPQELKQYMNTNRKPLYELIHLGNLYANNYAKYKAFTWYDWRVSCWGTKWNSFDYYPQDKDQIAFSTAWSAPLPVIRKLSLMYPHRKIEMWSASEDTGEGTFYYTVRNGKAKAVHYEAYTEESNEVFAKCWGYYPGEE